MNELYYIYAAMIMQLIGWICIVQSAKGFKWKNIREHFHGLSVGSAILIVSGLIFYTYWP